MREPERKRKRRDALIFYLGIVLHWGTGQQDAVVRVDVIQLAESETFEVLQTVTFINDKGFPEEER